MLYRDIGIICLLNIYVYYNNITRFFFNQRWCVLSCWLSWTLHRRLRSNQAARPWAHWNRSSNVNKTLNTRKDRRTFQLFHNTINISIDFRRFFFELFVCSLFQLVQFSYRFFFWKNFNSINCKVVKGTHYAFWIK